MNVKWLLRGGRLKIGFGNVGIYDKHYQRSILEIAGKIVLHGNAAFGHGSRLCVMKNGFLEIGSNFANTAQMTIVCAKNIQFGANVLTSWDTLVMDTDFHHTINIETHKLSTIEKPIIIGNNVWMGTRSVILKGSYLADNCVIGANSLIAGKFIEENCVIAGNPAKIVKKNTKLKR